MDLLGVAPDGLLHAERGVAGTHGMVLVSERRAEERHDSVAHHLVHGPLVPVDRLSHALEDGEEKSLGLLGVAVAEELHRAFEVSEEHRDLLALVDHGRAGDADLVGEVRRCVGLRRGGRRRRGEPGPAAVAEARSIGVVLLAARALHPFPLPAVSPSTM